MLPDVGMVQMYSKSANVKDLGFAWTGWPCMDRPSSLFLWFFHQLVCHALQRHTAPSLHLPLFLEETLHIKPTVSVCVFAITARVSCSVAIKLAVVAGGIGCQVIAGLTAPVLQFAESYPSISAFSFVDNSHFLYIVLINLRFLPDLIRYRPMFEFKPIIINFLAVAVTWVLRASGVGTI